MPACPQCGKALVELTRVCPSCKADLDLLVDYVQSLRGGLDRADQYTRGGELDKAVWAYLEVLETDPDNETARQQVARVATAVRQFDRTAPGRRWLAGFRGENPDETMRFWFRAGLIALLVAAAFGLGLLIGQRFLASSGEEPPPFMPKIEDPKSTLGGK